MSVWFLISCAFIFPLRLVFFFVFHSYCDVHMASNFFCLPLRFCLSSRCVFSRVFNWAISLPSPFIYVLSHLKFLPCLLSLPWFLVSSSSPLAKRFRQARLVVFRSLPVSHLSSIFRSCSGSTSIYHPNPSHPLLPPSITSSLSLQEDIKPSWIPSITF